MGLAASQARFLAITARKADCEYRSMEIAQEKLSITRELSDAADQYEEALDATKLVWDGETEDGTVYDLSYDVMMKPSELNGYTPYLVTNRTGQVVLSEQLALACEAAGIDEIATKSSLNGRNAFVQALADVGYISSTVADTITGASGEGTIEWSDRAGFGGELIDKSTASSMTIGTVLNYMENVLDPAFRNQFAASSTQRQNYDELAEKLTITNPQKSSADDKSKLYVGGSSNTDETFTVADLLTQDITLTMNVTKDDFVAALEKVIANGTSNPSALSSGNAEVDKLLTTFGSIAEGFEALFVDDTQTKDTQAHEFALKQTLSQISDYTADDGKKKLSNLLDQANDRNGAVYSKKQKTTAISLSNVAEMFLTNYAIALDGYDSSYYVMKNSADTNYVTSDYTYPYVLKNHGSLYDEKDLMITDFINVLYNNICSYGWTRSTGDLSDNEFLQNSLKNGKYFISSLNTDKYYYQDHYTKNGCVGEVTDEDAITRAEAEYTTLKSKLNYKEETLDLELKNLDLEISSLTTEYDTVKNMISKSVEKVFTMFSS